MVTFGISKPSNRIVAYPGEAPVQPLFKTGAATVKPGFLVKKGTDDNTVIITAASADTAIGVAGYETASAQYMPATLTTAYASGDEIPVLMGGGFLALLWHDTASETVNMGDYIMASAAVAGGVCKASALSITAGATSMTSSAANGAADISGASSPIPVVAQAMETVTFSGTAGWLLCKVLL